MGTQRKIYRRSLIKPPKKVPVQAAALADTGIMFEGKLRVFVLVPNDTPPDVAVSRFRYEMQRLKALAARPSIYDLYKESLKIQKKMENQESVVN